MLRIDPIMLFENALRAIHPTPLMLHQGQLAMVNKKEHVLNVQKPRSAMFQLMLKQNANQIRCPQKWLFRHQ
jgi:hypothetical protein